MIRNRLEEFGFEFTDSIVNGASYIMPDGKYLNIKQAGDDGILELRPHFNVMCAGHNQLDSYIKNQLFEDLPFMESDNAIKVNNGNLYPETPYITVPQIELTTAQNVALRDFINDIKISHQTLFVGYERDKKLIEFDLTETSTDAIVERIQKVSQGIYDEETKEDIEEGTE